jgi:hypothetical protein
VCCDGRIIVQLRNFENENIPIAKAISIEIFYLQQSLVLSIVRLRQLTRLSEVVTMDIWAFIDVFEMYAALGLALVAVILWRQS